MPSDQEKLIFYDNIVKIVHEKQLTFFEAVLYFCEQKNVEIELVATLIPNSMKAIIEEEAAELNLLTKSKTKKII